jgi:hypothetical protein
LLGEVNMKKDCLRYILKNLLQDFENIASSEQIMKFKEKYSGMKWKTTLEEDLLQYAKTTMAMERWIENTISFMMEHGIAREDMKYKYQ